MFHWIRKSRLTRVLRDGALQNPFTAAGRVFAIATAFCLLAIVEDSLSGLLSYLFWALAICFLCGYVFRPKLAVQVGKLELFHVGDRVHVPLTIVNAGRLPAYDVCLSLVVDRDNFVPLAEFHELETLSPGQSVTVHLPLQAMRRGCHPGPDLLSKSYFPFAMFSFNRSYRLNYSVAVAPSIKVEDVLGDLGAREPLKSGAGSRNVQGLCPYPAAVSVDTGYEYVGSREYQSGLAVRRWDFASWARMGKPAVREFSESCETFVVVVVDCVRSGRTNSRDASLERTLTEAATALSQLLSMGRSVIQFTIEDRVAWTESFANQPDACMRHLAEVVGSREQMDWLEAIGQIRGQVHSLQQLSDFVAVEWIVVVSEDNEAANLALENLSDHGETPSVLIAGQPHGSGREFAAANAEKDL